MQIEQKAAIRRIRHPARELAVPKFVAARAEIVHPGLDRDRHLEGALKVADRGCYSLHAADCLARWQEEASGVFRCLRETKMIADPRSIEITDRITQQRELRRLGGSRSPDRGS